MGIITDKSTVTVADVIEHLKTLPQDMEVWSFWDEGSCYFPLSNKKQGRINEIYLSKRNKEWVMIDHSGRKSKSKTKRKVCVLLGDHNNI